MSEVSTNEEQNLPNLSQILVKHWHNKQQDYKYYLFILFKYRDIGNYRTGVCNLNPSILAMSEDFYFRD